MDNIDEISPAVIIISARDFPRHWKIFVQFVRSERPKEICPIIILKGPNFSTEEASKAFFLGVSGVVNDALNMPEEIDRLQNILSRYVPVHEKRKHYRFFVEPWNRIGFIAAVPTAGGRSIVTGDVKTISAGGLSFLHDESMPPDGIVQNTELPECSLRIGDAILSPHCRVIRAGKTLSLEFISLPADHRKMLDRFLDEYPLLEVRADKAS
jgi:hypothetical protein